MRSQVSTPMSNLPRSEDNGHERVPQMAHESNKSRNFWMSRRKLKTASKWLAKITALIVAVLEANQLEAR